MPASTIINPEDFPPLNVSIDDQMTISLFCDGDACIRLSNIGNFRVEIAQAQRNGRPEVLEWIAGLFPRGSFHNPEAPRNANQRPKHKWVICGRNAWQFLNMLATHGIIKAPQAKLIVDAMSTQVGYLFDQVKQMKDIKAYQALEIDPKKVTWPAVAGIFLAEGCVGVYAQKNTVFRFMLVISQRASPKLLHEIRKLFGNRGNVTEEQFRVEKDEAIMFIRAIYPYLHGVKKPQCEKALQCWDLMHDENSPKAERYEKIAKLAAEIKQLKRL